MARRITLVRHGESLSNLNQRWQGQGNSALSELGRAQARALATRFAERAFTRIVASDLERADHTARALERKYESSTRFRELDVGAWDGLTRDEVATRFADELARLEAGEDLALGGGESYGGFCARVDGALAELRDALAPDEHALVVCHGGVIGAAVSGALGLRAQREVPISRVFNTSISELEYADDGRVSMRVYNDSLHLAGLSLFPHPIETRTAIALVVGAPDPAFGAFAAHYDYELGLDPGICTWTDDETPTFLEVAGAVRMRHAEHRIALSASSARVQAWSHELLGAEDKLAAPAAGALGHVMLDGRVALIDYGVSV
ncbi:MAG TPA: histidine phosphatase family protein [Polyangiales bacterium]|nr:histidine phosphatase family protein [Polyangiales bacterium]